MSESGQLDNLLNCKKRIDVSFSCICPVINDEFCHNIVKEADLTDSSYCVIIQVKVVLKRTVVGD